VREPLLLAFTGTNLEKRWNDGFLIYPHDLLIFRDTYFNLLIFVSCHDSWRYRELGDLGHVSTRKAFKVANAGFKYPFQMINVEDFEVGTQIYAQVCTCALRKSFV
jgi:hypothetical protein